MMGKKNTGPVVLTMTLEACFHRRLKKLLSKEKQGFVMGALREAMAECEPSEAERGGWKEAAIAWNVCASIHQQYAKGKDPLFSTRNLDYLRHHTLARSRATSRTCAGLSARHTAPATEETTDPSTLAAKFRPVSWTDISGDAPKVTGWGVERKGPEDRTYRPVLYEGALHPFKSKKEAQKVCKDLMASTLAGKVESI